MTIHRRHARLAQQKAATGQLVAEGRRFRRESTGTQVFNCPRCGSPVVKSEMGRKAHAQRKPECREAVEAA